MLEVPVAGLGSRLGAAALDGMIEVLVIGGLLLGVVGIAGTDVLRVALPTVATAVLLGYDMVFEARRSGRTPGKAAAGIRVVHVDGSPVTFRSSAVRNLLRLIDVIPGFYAVGAVSIVVTARSQRLGDVAAGTVVVRERRAAVDPSPPLPLPRRLLDELDTWDTSALRDPDVLAVERFVERRTSLKPEVRRRLAADLAGRLRTAVVAPSAHVDDELFLQQLLVERHRRDGR